MPPLPRLRFWRTLRLALRAAWDSLGLVCAASLTLFVALSVPGALLFEALALPGGSVRAMRLALALLAVAGLLAPLYAGACLLAHNVLASDEPSYLQVWIGAYRLYMPALLLAAAELSMSGILAASLLFYAGRGGFGTLLVGVGFLYLLLFWWMNCLYHWPLLVAVERGVIRRGGLSATWTSILRNGFLLAFSAPGYSFGLLFVMSLIAAPLAVSGVGMALLLGGLAAMISSQATRDQLVRFGVLAPQVDPDERAPDDVWRVQAD